MSEVTLYGQPWVMGMRAAKYFGPIYSECFWPDGEDRVEDWEKAERELLELLQDKAERLGANAVVGLEVTLDPFVERESVRGQLLRAVGTAAHLVSIWD